MDIELLKKILIANRAVIAGIEYVERDIQLEDNLNYVFVGIRQAGKSYLMYQRIHQLLKKGHSIDEIVYINMDDERLIGMTADDLDLILQAHYQLDECTPILFLDEIQNVEHWEKFARRLANEKYRVYITGSNAKMLSSEVATTLGGRYVIQEVYPYSLCEYLRANNIALEKNWEYNTKTTNALLRMFTDYFTYGGFPESVNIVQKRAWLSSLYQKIFLGDLIARYKIRNDFSLKLLAKKNIREHKATLLIHPFGKHCIFSWSEGTDIDHYRIYEIYGRNVVVVQYVQLCCQVCRKRECKKILFPR